MPEKGLLYFQLKDSKVFAETIFWMCDRGHYAPPFSGRALSVLSTKEMTGYFWMGIKPSIEYNPVSVKGYRAAVDFHPDALQDFRLITGAVPVPRDFTGVLDIVRKDAGMITILGRGDERIEVPCRVDALKD